MEITRVNEHISVAPQISVAEVGELAQAGFKSIICNRPDGEEQQQPSAAMIERAASAAGLMFAHVPAVSGAVTQQNAADMAKALARLPGPVFAYCRSGARSAKLVEMASAMPREEASPRSYDFVIVGGGSAGIATAASILKRNRDVSVAIIEPSEVHYYQPGWTMVGAGVFDPEFTRRQEAKLIPAGAEWIKASASGFAPDENKVLLCDGSSVSVRCADCLPWHQAGLGSDPGPSRNVGEERRHVKLQL